MEATQNRTVTAKSLKKALHYCIKAKRPAFIWGPMGAGKSSLVKQMCDEMGGKFYDMRLSQVEQTDLRGMPYYNRDTGKMDWAAPVDLPDAETAAKYPVVFLFLDEMVSAAPAVQAAAYQLVLDRKVGTYELPDNCVVIAAGNRDSDKGVVYRQPAPLSNRFVHFELRVDFDSWSDWALDNQIHADVMGFLSFSKNSLFDFDPKSSSKAFATPRSWEFVSELIADNSLDELTETDLIAGTIGEGLALKFLAHRKHASKLPDPAKILTGEIRELKIKEISAMYSLATTLAYELKAINEADKADGTSKFNECADHVLKYMLDNFSQEITVMAMKAMLTNYNLPFSTKLKNFKEFHEKLGKLIMKASQI